METRKLGPHGVAVPVIGQGTWNMEGDDRREAIASLRRGLDLGMTHIDTAEMYGRGKVEELVAEAIGGRRDEVFLVSKVLPQNASYEGTLRACERSLRHLRTDRLDVYLLHWPGSHPLEGTVRAFEELVHKGMIRAWGVSNFDVGELEEVRRIAGPGKIACNQVLYHLQERAIEHDVLPWCASNRVALVGYSPFGSGRFPTPKSDGGRALTEIAKTHGVTPHAVALGFLVREPGTFTIPKASLRAHAEENAAAGELRLGPDEIARIDRAFPRRKARGLPFL